MPIGPGRFDLLCTYVREKTGAKAAAVVVVLGPEDGGGFSVQCPPELYRAMSGIFRSVADQIDSEFARVIATPDPETPQAG